MRVLILGSGGREHVLAWKIAQSPLLTKLYAIPGNAGIAELAECHSIALENLEELCRFAENQKIDLTIVGPEAPLVAGIVDFFESRGLKIFGPSKAAARLEGSKAFAKDTMTKYGIPTADYEIFSNINEAKHYAVETEMPVVIKADGLAAGKGVVVCQSSQEAVGAITQMMAEGVFGDAGKQIIIERALEGEEFSILAFTDGEKIIPLPSSQDHKRAYDYDRGPNTGGMGAYSPCPQMPDERVAQAVDKVIRPVIEGMAKDGTPYRGIIYAGIMQTKDGPFVLEYNCRFGDPEAQAILPRLKSDFLEIAAQIASGGLQHERLEWEDRACLTVVMASGGYPGFYHKGFPIDGLGTAAKASPQVFVFHAGTAKDGDGKIVTAGGRVLTVSALGENLKTAHDEVYKVIPQIRFEGAFYRRDIGRRALEVCR